MKVPAAFLTLIPMSLAWLEPQPARFSSYGGFGQNLTSGFHYSQAVRMGNFIRVAGQGGWDANTGNISNNITIQIQNAFKNIDIALKAAGSRGLEDLVSIHSFHTGDAAAALPIVTQTMQAVLGDLEPTWTAVGVTQLAFSNQVVEIEAEAWTQ
ncbi:Endoribonuclease L-PSP/chorismate mutase-like protein [Xylogone sp. PMI_703]|nr:Endoribonuclease L-PSP/chorismate mutase-like protein [Xylogone sp. PMI_703]